ncbi:MAG: enoyl-CoA hydratase/isomerase family protein [Gammaproteobacteria bacterium]|nr:enoyl-CoA hydratase/isomerase family protein [Gammaproteobacteria bacterium]
MGYIKLEQTGDGIVELVFDQPGASVNTMGVEYDAAMRAAVAELQRLVAAGGVRGVYLRSGKPGQFFAGGDIKEILEMDLEPDAVRKAELFEGILGAQATLRALEMLGVPVAVGINGAALGGGFEIALACHYRIAIEGVMVGLPEAQLGLMPGAGGVVRTTRLIGMQEAIGLVSQGSRLAARKALEKGLLDEVVADEAQMHAQARAWLLANPEARQPWDRKDYRMPGGGPEHKANQGLLMLGPVNVMNQTRGLMPAQKAIFAAVADTARVDFDTALKIEARYFLSLLLDQTARNMMTAFFVQMSAINKGSSRPAAVARRTFRTLGIIGAGQMGAGIAYMAASKGLDVVLKDVDLAAAERGKEYARTASERNKRLDDAGREALLARIRPSDSYEDLGGCEAVIEAVFERRAIKATVVRELEAVLGHGALLASNTSALPITELAEASVRPANFIGMHFFSPADKMPLVEIICGEQTGDEALAAAFDLAQQLGKTPIVVNDAPGFFTSRVIAKTISQGAEMVLEGIDPVLIEAAARANGSPVGPLAAIDEISQETAYRNGLQMKADVEARGETWQEQPAGELIRRMVEDFGRKGRRAGGGYYDYPESGKKRIWPGMREHFAPDGHRVIPFEDIRDRLLYAQCTEAVRAMQEGVVCSAADGNIGSIMGIGFPPHTGGVFQYINACGLARFIARARELAACYGADFEPPKLLLDKAARGEPFV